MHCISDENSRLNYMKKNKNIAKTTFIINISRWNLSSIAVAIISFAEVIVQVLLNSFLKHQVLAKNSSTELPPLTYLTHYCFNQLIKLALS